MEKIQELTTRGNAHGTRSPTKTSGWVAPEASTSDYNGSSINVDALRPSSANLIHNDETNLLVCTIEEWLLKYGIKAAARLFPVKATFVDFSGTLRYVENWQRVGDSRSTPWHRDKRLRSLKLVGCDRVHISIPEAEPSIISGQQISEASQLVGSRPHKASSSIISSSIKTGTASDIVYEASFLTNYQVMWRYLERDSSDELAEHLPLFHAVTSLLFHRFTSQIMWFLSTYNLIVAIVAGAAAGKLTPITGPMATLGYGTLLVVYVAAMYVFTGRINTCFGGLCCCGGGNGGGSGGICSSSDVEMGSPLELVDTSMAHRPSLYLTGREGSPQHHVAHVSEQRQGEGQGCSLDGRGISDTASSRVSPARVGRSPSWLRLLRLVLSLGARELAALCCSALLVPRSAMPSTEHSSRNSWQAQAPQPMHVTAQSLTPFREQLNVSLKFLTRQCCINIRNSSLDRPALRLALLAIIFLTIPYQLQQTYVSGAAGGLIFCDPHSNSNMPENDCRFYFYVSIATLGYVTTIATRSLFALSVLVSLVGLAYGSEVAHLLAWTWIDRFGCLRKLGRLQSTVAWAGGADGSSGASVTGESSGEQVVHGKSSASATVRPEENIAIRKGQQRGEDIDEEEEEEEEVVNALHSDGGKSPQPADARYDYAGRRSQDCSRAMHQSPSPNEATVKPAFAPFADKPEREADVPALIKSESYEHYLFVREFMTLAGRSWSPMLTGFIFAILIIAGFDILLAVQEQLSVKLYLAYAIVFFVIRFLLLVVLPVAILAHANSHVYLMQERFRVAVPGDFELLGGRDVWLEFFAQVPAMWTYYGLWITWDRLAGMLWTLLVGLGALLVNFFLS